MTIKVHFDNGDNLITRFNGNVKDAVKYYIDSTFNLGTYRDRLTTARAIEFLCGGILERRGMMYRRLKRVYSVSPAYMQRHELTCKIRQTWECEDESRYHGFAGERYIDDYAYIDM